jgi:hypothetical protein
MPFNKQAKEEISNLGKDARGKDVDRFIKLCDNEKELEDLLGYYPHDKDARAKILKAKTDKSQGG